MGEAREGAAWSRHSRLMWVLASAHLHKRGGGSFSPNEFNPYAQREIVGEITASELGRIMNLQGRGR